MNSAHVGGSRLIRIPSSQADFVKFGRIEMEHASGSLHVSTRIGKLELPKVFGNEDPEQYEEEEFNEASDTTTLEVWSDVKKQPKATTNYYMNIKSK